MQSASAAPLVIFVMLTAILLGSFWAAAVAVMTAVVSLFLFEKHGAMVMTHESGEVWGLTIYSLYCAAAIAAVEFTRRTLARYSRLAAPREKSSGIIFSEEDGQAWASWPGNPSPVRLGPQLEVAAMMQDFILQTELAHRLARNSKTASEKTSLYAEPQDLR